MASEREDKFEVDPDFKMPRLSRAIGHGASVDTESVQLTSTYFDTDRLDLFNADASLRRRTGDTDTGWQLKLAARTDSRTEIGEPFDGSSDPADGAPSPALLELLAGVRRGRDVRPIAILKTDRTVHRIRDEVGTVLIEVADDTVTAVATGDSARQRGWREVEAELKEGTERQLESVAKLFAKHGASPSDSGSKLARALDRPGRGGLAGPDSPIARYLEQEFSALLIGDVRLRRGEDAIHRTRVACRRIRSTLRTFAPLFDEEPVPVNDELAWYAAGLGQVRDAQVMRARLLPIVRDLDPELTMGPVAATVQEDMTSQEQRGLNALNELMNTDRYFALLDTLERWVHAASAITATKNVRRRRSRLAGKTATKAGTRLRNALREGAPESELHRARKASKRARYAYEAVGVGADGRKKVKKFKRLQEELGEFQDAVVAKEALRRWAAASAGRNDTNGFAFGILWAREDAKQQAGTDALRQRYR